MQRASLRQNVSWTFVGNVLYAAGQMLILMLMAKLLDAERVGMYALGLAITTPIIIFSNYALRHLLATDQRSQTPFVHHFSLRIIMTAAAMLLIIGIVFFGGYRGELAAVILAIGLSKSIESISDIFYGLFQQHEQLNLMARSMIFRSVLMVPALAAGIVISGSAAWGVLGVAIAWFVVLVVYDIPQSTQILRLIESASENMVAGKNRLRFTFDAQALRTLSALAFPLAITTLLVSFQVQVPRYLVERYLGITMLGIYAGMTYPIIALRTLVGALGHSAAPRLALYHAQGKPRAFRILLLKMTGIGLVGGIAVVAVIAVAGRTVLALLYQPEFLVHADVFIWIAIAGAIEFIVSFTGYGMTALRIFKVQPLLSAAAILLVSALCVWLIPTYGLAGAAWATLATALLLLPVRVSIVWIGSRRPHPEVTNGR